MICYVAEVQNIPGLLLLVDFEKAFDSVSHDFLFNVLDNFNFGPSMKKWIHAFYDQATSSVLVNGFVSESFDIERGCRQGDGLSPYLFLLCAEVLSVMLCNHQNVKGIVVEGSEFLVSQYADDTVLFLDGTERSMYGAFNVLDHFANISGLRVNVDKTNAVWFGSMKESGARLCEDIMVNWVNAQDTFKVLGIYFSTNLRSIALLNYNRVLLSLRKDTALWSKRNLTVLGRVTVVKSLLMSKLTHCVLTIPDPPKHIVDELNNVFFQFHLEGERSGY